MLLRLFGASLGKGVVVHPSVKIWAPWNLVMDDHSCLGPYVDCYNCAVVTLGRYSVVSQYSFLCTATHDYTLSTLPLLAKPIAIGPHGWICADVFVGPGVSVGEGAVVGARSSVYKNVDPWVVVAGNPARFIKTRVVTDLP
jgi:putative colanic acid biosynthesis acetyltransferase WcaF